MDNNNVEVPVRTTQRIIGDFVGSGLRDRIHGKRASGLAWAAAALVDGKRLSLTGLGRGSRTGVGAKHEIKRANRLLGNSSLAGEHDEVFSWVAEQVLGGSREVVVAIDWTPISVRHGTNALFAAVVHDGRALPLLFEVHAGALKDHPRTEAAFLERLRRVIPATISVTLLADAGFRRPFFLAAIRNGFDVVIRLNSHVQLSGPAGWTSVRELSDDAEETITDLGVGMVNKYGSFEARVVRAPKRNRAPSQQATTPRGAGPAKKARKRHGRPWLLMTSLRTCSAETVHRLYKHRMQIEEYFRDKKNPRFGWSLAHARFASPSEAERIKRMANLLLIAVIAMLVMHVIGRLAEQARWHRQFQANTVARRVLALRYLAHAVLESNLRSKITKRRLRSALDEVRNEVAAVMSSLSGDS